jgi:4-amino-4-deoxychorismate lyase
MTDRGQAYGDGLFETMRVHRGEVPWWDAHWARLALGAQRLRIALPAQERVRARAAELLADGDDRVLKLLVVRGGNARGYAPQAGAETHWTLERHPLPPVAPGALRLHWCETRLAVQPLLAGIKHCNRLEQVLARAECVEAGADEGLVRDVDGNVVSATSANLFAYRDGAWLTPPLQRCGVAGTCRAALMVPLDAREQPLGVAAVDSAEAVFLCNAVRGILPVASIGTRRWPLHPAIAAARRALAALHPGFDPELE